MSTLLCSGCGIMVATIRDERFGLAPSGCVCPRCSHPAFRSGASVGAPRGELRAKSFIGVVTSQRSRSL